MTRKLAAPCLLAVIALLLHPDRAGADAGLLRTAQPLDDPRGYCLDIAGVGATLNLDQALRVHTCKYGEPLEDQQFERTADGAIKAPMYNRCLAVAALEVGAELFVRTCGNAPTQRWTMSWGRVSPASRSDLCLEASETSQPANAPVLTTPVYRRRDLALQRCDDTKEARQTFRWSLTSERAASSADIPRGTMPSDLAKQLATLYGKDDQIPQTNKIYTSQPRVYTPEEIKVTKNVPYGSHERQQMDIHTGLFHRADAPVPVIVAFHGGGLVGGSRANTANVADYFASLGYVGVTAGYRLAPEIKWPEGGRDVGAVVTWLRDHAAEYGGNPEQIFVVGVSTGAFHAATYVFRPELLPAGTARPAGAILLSGPYTFDFNDARKGDLAYFGEDKSRYPQMVVTGNVTRTDIPVLMTTAEWDPDLYPGPGAALYKELVDLGARPRYRQSLGHTHTSQLLSVGTVDTSVSREILDFIDRIIRR
jgi:triacylglycerol lipase